MVRISSFTLVLPLALLACSRHQANMPAVARNPDRQSNESPNQNSPAPVPSPIMSPTPEVELAFAGGLRIVPKLVKLENERRPYKIDVTYPQIEGTKDTGILKLYHRIEDLVTKHYQWLLIPPTKEDFHHYEKWPSVFNSVDLDYEVVLATDNLLSIYFELYSYGIGAAHSVQQSLTVNYDLKAGKLLKLSDLFRPQATHLEFISRYCMGELSKDHKYAMSNPTFKEELAPKASNYES
jgi:hypothetical protein